MDESALVPDAVNTADKRGALATLPRISALQPWRGAVQIMSELLALAPVSAESNRSEADDGLDRRLELFFGKQLDSGTSALDRPDDTAFERVQRHHGHVPRQQLRSLVQSTYGLDFASTPLREIKSANAPVLFEGKLRDAKRRALTDGIATVLVKAYRIRGDKDPYDYRDVLAEVLLGGAAASRLADGFPVTVTPHFSYVLDWFIGPTCSGARGAAPGVVMVNRIPPPETAPTAPTKGWRMRAPSDSDTEEDEAESDTEPEPVWHPALIEWDAKSGRVVDWTVMSQYVVEEHGGKPLTDLDVVSLRTRVVLAFQFAYTLEAFYQYNGGVHNDPHRKNVLVRNVAATGATAYANRAWLYKRADPTLAAYIIPPEFHENNFLELTDFGRARAWVDPSSAREQGLTAALVRESRNKNAADTHARRMLIGPTGFEHASQSRYAVDTSHDVRLYALIELIFSVKLRLLVRAGTGEAALCDEYVAALAHAAHLPRACLNLINRLHDLEFARAGRYFERAFGSKARAAIKEPSNAALWTELAYRFNEELVHDGSAPPDYRENVVNKFYDIFFSSALTEKIIAERHLYPTPTSLLDQPLFARFASAANHMKAIASEASVPIVAVGVARPQHIMAQPITNDTTQAEELWQPYQRLYYNRFIAPTQSVRAGAAMACAFCGQEALLEAVCTGKTVPVCNELCARFAHAL